MDAVTGVSQGDAGQKGRRHTAPQCAQLLPIYAGADVSADVKAVDETAS